MGKAPAFQWYPGDWRRDTQVQMSSFKTRGIWAEMLWCMWDSPERGKLAGMDDNLSRLIGCTRDEFNVALEEIKHLEIADVTECNNVVTIINRRMYKEAIDRNNTKKRVREYRERKSVQGCNGKVTPPSSSSSSKKKQTKKKNPESSPYLGDLSSKITELAEQLARLALSYPKNGHKNFNINGLIQELVNKKIHPQAIHVALSSLAKRWTLTGNDEVKNPRGYVWSIINTTSGNYYEREHIVKSQKFKNLEMPKELLR
ncbi:MAG TPA: hypothetical protein ENI07_05340 [Desulfobacterales bacterium]|nr:hypothetical protein [Desulfobacterales bacterium]